MKAGIKNSAIVLFLKKSGIFIWEYFAFIIVFFLALLPILEIFLRKVFVTGVRGSSEYVQHIVLILSFVGAVAAYLEKRHLSLGAILESFKSERLKKFFVILDGSLKTIVLFIFTAAALSFVLNAFSATDKAGVIPLKLIGLIMPVGFFLMFLSELREFKKTAAFLIPFLIFIAVLYAFDSIVSSLCALLPGVEIYPAADAIKTKLSWLFGFASGPLALIFIIVLAASLFLGNYIFVVLGGISLFLFTRAHGVLDVLANENYVMITGSSIPAIPLFTITGVILAESKAGERLLRFFNLLMGRVKGGLILVSVIMCAFFTTFTGASGVTILALGGLLSFMLIKRGYSEKFSYGILTASGSIGLLFPPSIAIIMYGVVARISIKKMFVAGIVPGFLMMLCIIILGIANSKNIPVSKEKIPAKEFFDSVKGAFWELLLPVVVIVSFFAGLTTIVESGALALLYAIIIECLVYKDLKLKDMKEIVKKSLVMLGGILIILGIAKGLSYYIVDAQIPEKLAANLVATIKSKYVFLLLLNFALLITGCLMDIFSAIVVVAPLIIPLGMSYGIDPVHLGIIFLCNLELGYLTPPVGLNLFLASYTFKKPLNRIYSYVVSFLIILLVSVLLITYVPAISTFLYRMFPEL